MKEQEYTIPDGAGPMPILDDEDPRSWKQIREDALFDKPLLLKEVALATPIKFRFLPSEPDDEHYREVVLRTKHEWIRRFQYNDLDYVGVGLDWPRGKETLEIVASIMLGDTEYYQCKYSSKRKHYNPDKRCFIFTKADHFDEFIHKNKLVAV